MWRLNFLSAYLTQDLTVTYAFDKLSHYLNRVLASLAESNTPHRSFTVFKRSFR